MLIRFSFKNFKSFKNENCIDMEATSLKEHEYNLAEVNKNKYLRVAAIYGANASGKTNALLAYNYMKRRILVSDDISKNNKIDDENVFSFMINNEPISMEVEILAKNNKIYKYGFEVLKDKVVSEWLYIRKAKGFSEIFERNNDNKVILKEAKKETQFTIDEDTLFLNLYTKLHSDNLDFANVYEWFVESIYLDLGNPKFESIINNRLSIKMIESKEYRNELIKFIKNIDPGIEDIRTSIDKMEDLKNANTSIKIEVIHRTESNGKKALPIQLESNGTKRMFYLFDFLMDALRNGNVLFIDELDAKLHPLLTKYIINLFHNSEINKNNGQLIYSTHDTVNLNKDTFRRDEIWFAEKNLDGESRLYSLADYKIDNVKVRNDATYNKDYLTGRYGAIPVFEEFGIGVNER